MNITHLKYAIEVLKTQSITKASQNLYMGQPNLSKALKDFEKEIGIKLFIRNVKGVKPTQKGLQFLLSAQQILSQLDSLEKGLNSDVDNCFVNISVPRCAGISKAFINFLNKYKNYNQIIIKFRETSAENVISDVLSGQSDFGILRYQKEYEKHFLSQVNYSELSYKVLAEFSLCLLIHKSHPLANKDVISQDDLIDFIEITQGDYYISKSKQNLQYNNKRICVYDRASQYDLLREVNGTYMWVSNVPEEVLSLNDLIIKKCDIENNISKDVFIYKDEMIKSQTAIDFLNSLEKTLS